MAFIIILFSLQDSPLRTRKHIASPAKEFYLQTAEHVPALDGATG